VDPGKIRSVDHLKTENLKNMAMSIVNKAESLGIDLKSLPGSEDVLEVISSKEIPPTRALEVYSLLKRLEERISKLERERRAINEMKQRITNLMDQLSTKTRELSGRLEELGIKIEGLPDPGWISSAENERELEEIEDIDYQEIKPDDRD